jgi:sialidase-1
MEMAHSGKRPDGTMTALRSALLLCVLVPMRLFAGEPEFGDVFIPQSDGFKSTRIPSLVVTQKGTVLAFAEGRAANADQAKNKIISKRSTDAGRTWSAVQTLADDGDNSLNNPCAVEEKKTGRVFLMYQRIPAHLKESSKATQTGFEGDGIYRNFLIWSDDDGVTWTKPLDVTRTTKHATGATTVAGGPGIGIQLTRGPHKDRLIIPFNEGPYGQWNNFAVYSDDRGASWAVGDNVPGAMVGKQSQINEVQMVELSDGSVMLNSRQFAGEKVRKTAISRDGGVTWSKVEGVPELPDPSCMASILRYSFADDGGKSILLYSGPDSTKRDTGTIHISYDEGKTWPIKRVLRPGSFAYSVLTRFPDGTIGCLFEERGKISFARIALDWIVAGNEWAPVEKK